MNDDLTLLASAYLDGDVTADERARVEADPALLVEVDRLRYVRVLLADVEPSSISVRESLLANALDAWDRVPAPPISLAERRRPTHQPPAPGCRSGPGARARRWHRLADRLVRRRRRLGDAIGQRGDQRTRGRSARRIRTPKRTGPKPRSSPTRWRRRHRVLRSPPPTAPNSTPASTMPRHRPRPNSNNSTRPRNSGSSPPTPSVRRRTPRCRPQPANRSTTDSPIRRQRFSPQQWPLCLGADYVVGPARTEPPAWSSASTRAVNWPLRTKRRTAAKSPARAFRERRLASPPCPQIRSPIRTGPPRPPTSSSASSTRCGRRRRRTSSMRRAGVVFGLIAADRRGVRAHHCARDGDARIAVAARTRHHLGTRRLPELLHRRRRLLDRRRVAVQEAQHRRELSARPVRPLRASRPPTHSRSPHGRRP